MGARNSILSDEALLFWCLVGLLVLEVAKLVRELVLLMDAFLMESFVRSTDPFPGRGLHLNVKSVIEINPYVFLGRSGLWHYPLEPTVFCSRIDCLLRPIA